MFFRQMRQRVTEKMHSNLVRLHSGRRMPFRAECVLRKAGVHGQCVPAFLMKSRHTCICQPALRSTPWVRDILQELTAVLPAQML